LSHFRDTAAAPPARRRPARAACRF
jgi:hypothetical protein